MTLDDKTISTDTHYACTTAGGGAMFIPKAIERVNTHIHQAELDHVNCISYAALLDQKPAPAVTRKTVNLITKSLSKAKDMLRTSA